MDLVVVDQAMVACHFVALVEAAYFVVVVAVAVVDHTWATVDYWGIVMLVAVCLRLAAAVVAALTFAVAVGMVW